MKSKELLKYLNATKMAIEQSERLNKPFHFFIANDDSDNKKGKNRIKVEAKNI